MNASLYTQIGFYKCKFFVDVLSFIFGSQIENLTLFLQRGILDD